MNELMKNVAENVVFVLEFLGIVILIFLVAYAFEKWEKKKNQDTQRILTTRKIAMAGMFSAISAILMVLEFPIPFAPEFYKLDFSEIPALIGAFAFGPVTGVMIEFCKVVLKVLIKGTSTAFVGDLANFVVGCSFLLPASLIYMNKKSKKTALIGSITGTLCMTLFGTVFNAVYLLPKFSQIYGMPLDVIVGMGTAVNHSITDVMTLVLFAVAPLNLLKGAAVSTVTMLVYKKLSRILKADHSSVATKKTAAKITQN